LKERVSRGLQEGRYGMRVSIKFETDSGILNLPIHYNHLIQSMIYKNLDKALSEWLHDRGYEYGKRRFKLFTFSRLLSPGVRIDKRNRRIILKTPLYLKIGAMEKEILESLAVHFIKNNEILLNGTPCKLTSIEVEVPVKVCGPVKVKAISPITVYRTLYDREGRKKTYYFNPKENEFSELIFDNLRRKAISYYGGEEKLPPLNKAYIKPIKVTSRDVAKVNFKGTWIIGWRGVYEINLPEPYFTLAYNSGLGSKNSQGFGMIDVVRDRGV
jgi:CRISPR-associated endoribonuclease Cas6